LESTQYSLDAKPEKPPDDLPGKGQRRNPDRRLSFLPGETATYSQMAAAIRSEMLADGELPAGEAVTQALPLVIKAVGAIDETKWSWAFRSIPCWR
jgi:hypothetical protein